MPRGHKKVPHSGHKKVPRPGHKNMPRGHKKVPRPGHKNMPRSGYKKVPRPGHKKVPRGGGTKPGHVFVPRSGQVWFPVLFIDLLLGFLNIVFTHVWPVSRESVLVLLRGHSVTAGGYQDTTNLKGHHLSEDRGRRAAHALSSGHANRIRGHSVLRRWCKTRWITICPPVRNWLTVVCPTISMHSATESGPRFFLM